MKSNRTVCALALILSLMLLFSACGGSSAQFTAAASSAAPAAAAPAAPKMKMESTAASDSVANGYIYADTEAAEAEESVHASLPADRKIVKHSNLELEAKEFDAALEQIFATVSAAGGYIESQSISGQSLRHHGDYYERFANINARIPADKLDDVTEAIGGLCNVTSKWEGVDDITDTYFDTDARLSSLKLQEERLLDILSKAESLEDIITLEAKLSDVRYEIESLTARIRRMDSQVAYSYLNMTLNEVVEYQQVVSAPKTFSERISDAFGRSGRRITNFFENSVIFVIEDLPLLLINIIIWVVVIFVVARLACFLYFKATGKYPKSKKLRAKNKTDEAAPAESPDTEQKSEE